jgi:hypothetical protein
MWQGGVSGYANWILPGSVRNLRDIPEDIVLILDICIDMILPSNLINSYKANSVLLSNSSLIEPVTARMAVAIGLFTTGLGAALQTQPGHTVCLDGAF